MAFIAKRKEKSVDMGSAVATLAVQVAWEEVAVKAVEAAAPVLLVPVPLVPLPAPMAVTSPGLTSRERKRREGVSQVQVRE